MKLIFGTGGRFGRFNYKKSKKIIDFAINKGIRRFDTGFTYCNYKSQPLLAKCLRPYLKKDREKIEISTKCPPISAEYIEKCVHNSLSIFQTSYIDYFH